MKEVTMYCDGACSGNPGPGGWGVVLIFGKYCKEISGTLVHTTNNQAELIAVLKGLTALKEPCSVTVHTDSLNVVGWLQGGWKRKNAQVRELCAAIDLLVAGAGHQVSYEWVRGHNGHEHNERADELATDAASCVVPQ